VPLCQHRHYFTKKTHWLEFLSIKRCPASVMAIRWVNGDGATLGPAAISSSLAGDAEFAEPENDEP